VTTQTKPRLPIEEEEEEETILASKHSSVGLPRLHTKRTILKAKAITRQQQ